MMFLHRFRVKIEYIKPDKLDAGTTIKGLDYIDVPRLATRDYKLTFHSYKECQPLIKVFYSPHTVCHKRQRLSNYIEI